MFIVKIFSDFESAKVRYSIEDAKGVTRRIFLFFCLF